MSDWMMLTLVGEDRPGIVAQVTDALYRNGWSLGEASMMRLGASFTIMMMVGGGDGGESLQAVLAPVAAELGLAILDAQTDDPRDSELSDEIDVAVLIGSWDRANTRATHTLRSQEGIEMTYAPRPLLEAWWRHTIRSTWRRSRSWMQACRRPGWKVATLGSCWAPTIRGAICSAPSSTGCASAWPGFWPRCR